MFDPLTIMWLAVATPPTVAPQPSFAQQLLDLSQGPFVAVGTFVTFGSGLYAFWEWIVGGWPPRPVGRRKRNWDELGQAVNQGIAVGFLAGIPWFGVALWAGIEKL